MSCNLINNSTVRDSDFNLSQSDITGNNYTAVNISHTGDNLKKGDNLYNECKEVFFDLQKQKNQNNALVE